MSETNFNRSRKKVIAIARLSRVAQTEAQIKEMIRSDAFEEGTKLPSEGKLCESLGVSRPTVREALRSLQVQGYVEIRQGSGAFLRAKAITPENATNWFGAHGYEVRDCLEIRLSLETLATRLAAERAKEDDIILLFGVENLFEKAVAENDILTMSRYDEMFHRKIAQAAHNDLLVKLIDNISQMQSTFRDQTFTLNKGDMAITEHNAVLFYLRKHDSDNAVIKMEAHIRHNIELIEEILHKQK